MLSEMQQPEECGCSTITDAESTPQKRPLPMHPDITPNKLPQLASRRRSSSRFVDDQDVKRTVPATCGGLLTEMPSFRDRTPHQLISSGLSSGAQESSDRHSSLVQPTALNREPVLVFNVQAAAQQPVAHHAVVKPAAAQQPRAQQAISQHTATQQLETQHTVHETVVQQAAAQDPVQQAFNMPLSYEWPSPYASTAL